MHDPESYSKKKDVVPSPNSLQQQPYKILLLEIRTQDNVYHSKYTMIKIEGKDKRQFTGGCRNCKGGHFVSGNRIWIYVEFVDLDNIISLLICNSTPKEGSENEGILEYPFQEHIVTEKKTPTKHRQMINGQEIYIIHK